MRRLLLFGVAVCCSTAFSPTPAAVPGARPKALRPAALLSMRRAGRERAHPVQMTEGKGERMARRLLLLSGICSAACGSLPSECNAAKENPRALTSRGMDLFKNAQVADSLSAFDRAIELDERYKGILWQRGLSLYYADRFADASEQFVRDVALNPRDTEEAVWALLSQARAEGSWDKAQKNVIDIRGERRPYMLLVYRVCQGKTPVEQLEQLATSLQGNSLAEPEQKIQTGLLQRPVESTFYLNLYAGLIAEAQGRDADAQKFLLVAAQSPYKQSDDYMWHLAKVHCIQRGWLK